MYQKENQNSLLTLAKLQARSTPQPVPLSVLPRPITYPVLGKLAIPL